MIHSTLDESARYESLHPRFKEVFDYIKSHDLRAMEPQRLELRGEELFINRIDAPSNPQDEQPIEAHESYIDIQVLLEGRERIGWLPRAKCLSPRAPYDESKDIIFYHDQPTSYVDLLPGDFVILGTVVWDEMEDHLKAMKELEITWPQIFNKTEATELYGIAGIPQIILFDPAGKIVARDLRGEEINKLLDKALQDNGGKL